MYRQKLDRNPKDSMAAPSSVIKRWLKLLALMTAEIHGIFSGALGKKVGKPVLEMFSNRRNAGGPTATATVMGLMWLGQHTSYSRSGRKNLGHGWTGLSWTVTVRFVSSCSPTNRLLKYYRSKVCILNANKADDQARRSILTWVSMNVGSLNLVQSAKEARKQISTRWYLRNTEASFKEKLHQILIRRYCWKLEREAFHVLFALPDWYWNMPQAHFISSRIFRGFERTTYGLQWRLKYLAPKPSPSAF